MGSNTINCLKCGEPNWLGDERDKCQYCGNPLPIFSHSVNTGNLSTFNAEYFGVTKDMALAKKVIHDMPCNHRGCK